MKKNLTSKICHIILRSFYWEWREAHTYIVQTHIFRFLSCAMERTNGILECFSFSDFKQQGTTKCTLIQIFRYPYVLETIQFMLKRLWNSRFRLLLWCCVWLVVVVQIAPSFEHYQSNHLIWIWLLQAKNKKINV